MASLSAQVSTKSFCFSVQGALTNLLTSDLREAHLVSNNRHKWEAKRFLGRLNNIWGNHSETYNPEKMNNHFEFSSLDPPTCHVFFFTDVIIENYSLDIRMPFLGSPKQLLHCRLKLTAK